MHLLKIGNLNSDILKTQYGDLISHIEYFPLFTFLGNCVEVYLDGDLILKGCTGLKKLPDILYVGGELTVRRCRQLTKLPDNLYVDGYLDLDNSGITNIPDDLYVEADMYIYGTPLADNYTDEEIRKVVTSTGGKINGRILR
jgi:hypothetical protein